MKTSNISILNPGLLNPQDELYSHLMGHDIPDWWSKLRSDPEIYIEIRKKNIIDAYYRGARIVEIKWDKKRKEIVGTCHSKYLYGPSTPPATPDYVECLDDLAANLEEIKNNSIISYSKKDNDESISEKRIQGELIVTNRNRYIDSEFAHRYEEGQRKTIRIDLVTYENGRIVFEELKRISDSRLLTKDENPEILCQMKEYADFISANQEELKAYYKTLLNIKSILGLPVPESWNNEVELQIDIIPRLIIKNTYSREVSVQSQKKRDNRIKLIEDILSKNKILFSIF